MADEVRIQAPGPNGNGLQLDLTQKKFGLTGPNVALLLLIIIIGGVAYLRTGTIDATMKAGQEQIAGVEDRVGKRVDQLFLRMDKLIDNLHTQDTLLHANNTKVITGQHELRTHFDEALGKQDTLVHSQTQAIDQKVNSLEKYIEAWFTEMAKRDDIHNHNTLHPDKALPLRATAPHEDRQHERGR